MEDWQEWRSCNNRSTVFPCPDFFEDPIFKLKKLEQTGSIKEYYETFDSIRQSIDLPEEFFISWFIAGLRSDMRKELQTCRFTSVVQAYALGRMYEIAYPRSAVVVESQEPAPYSQSLPLQSVPVQELSSSASPFVLSSIPAIQESPTLIDSSSTVTETVAVKLDSRSALQSSSLSTIPLERDDDPQREVGKTIRVNDHHEQDCKFSGVLEAKIDAPQLFDKMPKLEMAFVEESDSEVGTKVVGDLDSKVESMGVSTGSFCLSFGVNDHEQICDFSGVLEAKIDAYQLFEEMPEPIPMLKRFSGDIFGISVDERLIKYGFISLIFDPGGENHKRLAEFEKQFGENCKFKSVDTRFAQAESEDDNQLEGNSENVQNMVTTHYASKLLDEMSIRNLESVLLAKITAGSLGEESSFGEFFVHISLVPRFAFDPGGQEGIEMDVQAEIEGFFW